MADELRKSGSGLNLTSGPVGAIARSLILLNPAFVSQFYGWRLGRGAVLGTGILLVRRHIPESPRWLMTCGKVEEAERGVGKWKTRCGTTPGAMISRSRGRIYNRRAAGGHPADGKA